MSKLLTKTIAMGLVALLSAPIAFADDSTAPAPGQQSAAPMAQQAAPMKKKARKARRHKRERANKPAAANTSANNSIGATATPAAPASTPATN